MRVAENSVVDNATNTCSLHCIFATILANSSASLGRPYFYRRHSKEQVSYHRHCPPLSAAANAVLEKDNGARVAIVLMSE
jgi:hypothetical protein